MHGLIFASLRDYTALRLGEERAVEFWADRIFETTEAYDDQWFAAQLERLVVATGDSMAEAQRGFGSFAAQTTFAGLYPAYRRVGAPNREHAARVAVVHALDLLDDDSLTVVLGGTEDEALRMRPGMADASVR